MCSSRQFCCFTEQRGGDVQQAMRCSRNYALVMLKGKIDQSAPWSHRTMVNQCSAAKWASRGIRAFYFSLCGVSLNNMNSLYVHTLKIYAYLTRRTACGFYPGHVQPLQGTFKATGESRNECINKAVRDFDPEFFSVHFKAGCACKISPCPSYRRCSFN